MRVLYVSIMIVFASLLFEGCGGGASSNSYGADGSLSRHYRFAVDTDGWQGGFAEYPVGEASAYALRFSYARLPAPLDESEGALLLSADNLDGDLFMYVKRPLFGLDANRTYAVQIGLTFASNIAEGDTGMENVAAIKAGASPYEPLAVADENGKYRMNIDKGDRLSDGTRMIIAGDLSNDTNLSQYVLKTVRMPHPVEVTTDTNGTLWMIVGIDSESAGETTIYIDTIEATVTPK